MYALVLIYIRWIRICLYVHARIKQKGYVFIHVCALGDCAFLTFMEHATTGISGEKRIESDVNKDVGGR